MSDLILVVESRDGRVVERPLSEVETIRVEAGAAYALIDGTTGMPPEGLHLNREDEDLEIEVDDQTVVRIDDFYTDEVEATFSLDGSPVSIAPPVIEAPASSDGLGLPNAVDVAAGAEGEIADVAASDAGLFGFIGWNWTTALAAGAAVGTGVGAAAIIDNQSGSSSGRAATTVVFDLTAGASSNHSARVFEEGVAYDIYILVDSESAGLSTPPSWTGTIGADDQITLVGSGDPVIGRSSASVTDWFASTGSSEGLYNAAWSATDTTSTSFTTTFVAASLNSTRFYREFSSGSSTESTSDNVGLWSVSVTGVPIVGYLTAVPAGLLTTGVTVGIG